MLLSGRLVDADEAQAAGLATRVVPVDRLETETLTIAADLRPRAREHDRGDEGDDAASCAIIAARPRASADEILIRECYGSAGIQRRRRGVSGRETAALVLSHEPFFVCFPPTPGFGATAP